METDNYYFSIYIFATTLLMYYLYVKYKAFGKSPPGPYGLPLVGYLPFLRKDIFRQLKQMSETYGNVFQVQIGTRPVLVLNDWESINEALGKQWDVFSGRPDLYSFRIRTNYKDIVGQNSTPAWKHQRRFAFSTLRDMGMGKSTAEMAVLEEVEKLSNHLDQFSGQIIKAENIFFTPVINVIFNIASGMTFKYGSEEMEQFAQMLHKNMLFIASFNIINIFPFLRKFSSKNKEYHSNNQTIIKLLRKIIQDHKFGFECENEPKDYIEAYLNQLSKQHEPQQENRPRFTEERLLGDLYIFFHAGSETTSSSLAWAVLFMAVWPNIQRKVQQEMDRVIGKSKRPQYSDRQILPYTYATVLEVQRYASIVPLSIPHMSKTSTKLGGFDIPANMTTWPNLWAVSHDPKLWGDPEVFRPERFIDDCSKVHKPDYFVPFSLGARRCLGERLAKMELFLFFSAVMQRFTFQLADGHPLPTLEPIVGVTTRPHPYKVLIQSRI